MLPDYYICFSYFIYIQFVFPLFHVITFLVVVLTSIQSENAPASISFRTHDKLYTVRRMIRLPSTFSPTLLFRKVSDLVIALKTMETSYL